MGPACVNVRRRPIFAGHQRCAVRTGPRGSAAVRPALLHALLHDGRPAAWAGVYVDGGRGTIPADRRRGYRVAMRRCGLDGQVRVLAGDQTEAAGVRAAEALLAGGPLPTAVVAFNDRSAVGLLDTLTRAGIRVPDQVSVIGYDDSPQSRWAHVELTTVSQEGGQQAERAVTAAVERLEGRVDAREVVLTPRLVVRATTGPPPVRRH